jgi:hypothetical protein
MPKYSISGLPTHYLAQGDNDSSVVEQNTLRIEVEKVVLVASLAELQQVFDAYCEELSGEGKKCYRIDATPFQGVRVFPGFKKASKKDGSLNRVINKDEAIARARADYEHRSRKTA